MMLGFETIFLEICMLTCSPNTVHQYIELSICIY